MNATFQLYQYIVPALLFPLAYWLWLGRCGDDHRCVAFVLSMPILFAYVIPGLGTNWLKLWEFNTRFRLGRFRPHHGFVFGTATSLFALVCQGQRPDGLSAGDVARSAFILGSVLALWNWLYDILAIRAGFIVVYNRPFYEQAGPEAIATDYAPVLFGVFGACYGGLLRVGEYWLLKAQRWDDFWWLMIASNVTVLVVPVAAFAAASYVRNGTFGLSPLKGD